MGQESGSRCRWRLRLINPGSQHCTTVHRPQTTALYRGTPDPPGWGHDPRSMGHRSADILQPRHPLHLFFFLKSNHMYMLLHEKI